MKIQEVFDMPVKWSADYYPPADFIARFTVGEMAYSLRALVLVDEDDNIEHPTSWDIDLGAHFPNTEYEDADGSGEITGTGNQHQVFATTVDIIKHFIEKYKPDIITLSAKEPHRQKLYRKMIHRLLSHWSVTERGKSFILINPDGNAH